MFKSVMKMGASVVSGLLGGGGGGSGGGGGGPNLQQYAPPFHSPDRFNTTGRVTASPTKKAETSKTNKLPETQGDDSISLAVQWDKFFREQMTRGRK